MEKRKYNKSLGNMQVFALNNAELNEITGGHDYEGFFGWLMAFFNGYRDDDDGGVSHGGGPK